MMTQPACTAAHDRTSIPATTAVEDPTTPAQPRARERCTGSVTARGTDHASAWTCVAALSEDLIMVPGLRVNIFWELGLEIRRRRTPRARQRRSAPTGRALSHQAEGSGANQKSGSRA